MKFIAYFFLKKLDPRGTQEQSLGAYSRDFPDTKVAIEETKGEADVLGADVFELETDTGSIRQRWEAQSGHHDRAQPCPLSGAKQTSVGHPILNHTRLLKNRPNT
jgi:hypothetical protein